jgi:ribonuclease BN (tRNA processing enzyme)
MSGFEVLVLGVGDTFSEIHHPTSLLLRAEGVYLAIDCPDMYRRVLRDARARCPSAPELPEIDHFLLTHVHGDHMNGLEGVAFFKKFAEKKRAHLLTTTDVRRVIWDQRLVAPMGRLWNGESFVELGFEDYFTYTQLDWNAENRVGPFSIRLRRTKHHVPTSALSIEAGGRRFGYSADTAFDPELIEFLSAADLIIHETNLGPAHTLSTHLAGLPEALRRRMRLIHYPDFFDPSTVPIDIVREGDLLAV